MKHTVNMKVYELSNHLGNVLVPSSDALVESWRSKVDPEN
jgi:hypothetical protein